jgi:cellulose synthase/poly-beta-1,6-N-acetylglucosamine synthase-like glycosyltransferase/spore germination protein YaaH/peptidoglycan/xylan/chitin deacetylase (PgdA/CDA1 family)
MRRKQARRAQLASTVGVRHTTIMPPPPDSPSNKPFVFHDPSGRRARRAGQAGGLMLSLLAAIVAGFFATLALAPRLPTVELRDPRVLQALHEENAKHLRGRPAWQHITRPRVAGTNTALKPLTVGFYVSWDADSRASLVQHVGSLDIVAPQWFALKDGAGDVDITDDPQAVAVIASAPHPPAVLPVVHNAREEAFDPQLGAALMRSTATQDRLIATLVDQAQKKDYSGYIFDIENITGPALAAYPAFIARARAALKPLGREVWVTAPLDDDDWPLKALQDASDTLMLMGYDQHWQTGQPGPTAGEDWFEKYLDNRLSKLDPNHVIMALGSYGYDWTLHGARADNRADPVNFQETIQNALDSEADIVMDDDALNPHYGYMDEDGTKHAVWFLDATTLFNQVKVTDPWRVRGYALWRMGSEDPGVWSVLGQPYGQVSAAGLTNLAPGSTVDFNGTGEVLKVTATPSPGKRSLTFDPDTGLIADEHYDQLPTSYEIDRYGAHPGWVALTFDDGPDWRWTPQILDILKAKQAPATFFVIGKNMQAHPGIVKREVDQGLQVGSHTYTHPNIAALPAAETDLELNATQRLFAVVTGKSFRLFRPPYFGDAEPSTPAEVNPLVTAQKLGYLIVGLRIDPDDWKKPDASLIVSRTLAKLADPGTPDQPGGQIVLLHDSGGDRSRTVKALPTLIDQLRAHGYTLVTVGQLAGLTPEQAMPPTNRSWMEVTLDRIGFGIFREIDVALTVLFVSAIALGVLRLVFLAILSVVHKLGEDRRRPADLDPETGPLVSVLIPCFNEEKVIASSVARILESHWSRLEVIVLDDGSSDGTSAEVERHFAHEPRVRLMTFPNGGKALALNRGLDQVKGDIVVALDADTLFAPSTIARLARWFVDPRVGAVAGNALVGNRRNLITRWQALEYVTAQNLERRALAALGAVTVVPGAVGAWRRAALEQLGGYPADTLAEDQDLTMAVQQAGWRVEFDPDARAYTEAPETVAGLLKQRFRWSFGTLQCLWKHRTALFSRKRPVLGFIALPQIWLFQIILATAAPLVDLAVVWSLISAVLDHFFHPVEWSSDQLVHSLLYWAAFIFVDLSAAALGMALEKRAPWTDLPWIPVQRFGYRQLMYYVVVKAVITAVRGPRVGWGKLERRATAAVERRA